MALRRATARLRLCKLRRRPPKPREHNHRGFGVCYPGVIDNTDDWSPRTTVIAKDGITSDSTTKVISVLGAKRGFQTINQTPGVVARIMNDSGDRIEVSESKGFARCYDAN